MNIRNHHYYVTLHASHISIEILYAYRHITSYYSYIISHTRTHNHTYTLILYIVQYTHTTYIRVYDD